ncbi:MAG: hypothetical protein DDT37_01387 [Firmicutes bacterium]|nr:hypothetical protein [candidate division NPL-UPA2 bacterium]
MARNVHAVDARGLSCPIPVVRAREALVALKLGAELEVLVDEAIARENVSRLFKSHGLRPNVKEIADGWSIAVVKQ